MCSLALSGRWDSRSPQVLISFDANAGDHQDQSSRGAPPIAHATRTSLPIHLDGTLDEPAWQDAQPIGPLVQAEPLEGVPASEATEVRVLYDGAALYFGILCRDRTPSDIVHKQLTRDADLDDDDRVTIVLDPLLDQRNGFFFEVNPSGARSDGQISNNSERLSREWDGIWNAAARVTDEGWIAEVEIPFKSLRIQSEQSIWGLNVERLIKRRNELARWSGPRRDVWIGNLTEAGRLDGLSGLREGRGLDIRPYVAGGDENSDGQFDVGVDVFKTLTPGLDASVTVNTDFAETEVDARQVNLTRFPLFFPEKRAFFLEGAGVFDVAGLTNSQDIIPFFSRRIGLLEVEENNEEFEIEVPILAGAKIIGRQSGFNIGFLNVQTRDIPGNDQTGQNLMTARVSRNFLKQSWIGAIMTNGNPEGTGGNTLVGADSRLATSTFRGSKNLSLDLFALRTTQRAGKDDFAAGFRIDYPNDLWDVALSFKHIGENFAPALGFAPRTGIRKTNLGVEYQPRPHGFGIRQFFFEFRPEYITNLENRVVNWRIFTAPFNVETESAEHLEWNVIPEYEHLDEPFEISPGIIIPPGSYQWTRFRAEANTATKRPWVVDFALWWGGFYSGTRREIEFGLTFKPTTHLYLRGGLERNDVSLVEGDFHTQIVTGDANYNFTPNVSWANLIQYDTESRILGVQSRFRWILRPGSDLFLVVNRGWTKDPAGTYVPEFDKGSAKLQYTIRL